MERSARHRRSESASAFEGLGPIQARRTVSRFSPNYPSSINGSGRDDTVTVERGQSSSRRAAERPMARLLAEKMYKEIEPKRGSGSGIARLMHLEGLNSLWNVHRQRKILSDRYRENNVSLRVEPNGQIYDGRHNRRSQMRQQGFDDVEEDLGEASSSFVRPRRSSRWYTGSMLTIGELPFIRQKIDVKHALADETDVERLRDSKHLLMNYVSKRDCSFANQRVNASSSLGSRKAILFPPSSAKYDDNANAWVPDRDAAASYGITSHPRREDGLLLEPHYRHWARMSHRASNIRSEGKKKREFVPEPIVVLRPDLVDMHSAALCGSSSYDSHGYIPNFSNVKEYPSVGGAEVTWRRKSSYIDAEFSKPKSGGVRKLAREITDRIRDACHESEDAPYSGFSDYAADKNLYDARRSDFNSESVNREGKKRHLERWKITHRYQDLELVGMDSTLSKSYAYRGNDRSNAHVDIDNGSSIRDGHLGMTSSVGLKNETQRTSPRSRSLPPIGGRSQRGGASCDGFAEEKHLMHGDTISCGSRKVAKEYPSHKDFPSSQGSKSRSKKRLPCPPIYFKETDSSIEASFEIKKEANFKDFPKPQVRFQMAGKNDDCSGIPVSGTVIAEHGSTNSSSKSPVLHPKHSSVDDESSAAAPNPEENSYQVSMPHNPNYNRTTSSSKSPLLHPKHSSVDDESSAAARNPENFSRQASMPHNSNYNHTTSCSKSPLLHPKHSSVDDVSSAAANNQEIFSQQDLHHGPPEEDSPSLHDLGADPVSSEIFKDDYHASPVSVFEVPFEEDASSSSESSGRSSAELNELRMRLQLLKMEYGAYDEISTLIAVEKDVSRAEGWEVSYTLDVLICSGFKDFGFDMFRTMSNSPDCPLDPSLFDDLEKKYTDETSGLRSERQLLFDRINSALLQIFQRHVDLSPWVMPKLEGSLSTRKRERKKDALDKLMSENTWHEQISGRIVERDMKWELTEEIALMCREIEDLLIDDMITEILCD